MAATVRRLWSDSVAYPAAARCSAARARLARRAGRSDRGCPRGPDDDGDPDPGQVLGPVQAVGVLVGRSLAREAEAQEHHGLRQLALGGIAVAVTFAVGHLIGSHAS